MTSSLLIVTPLDTLRPILGTLVCAPLIANAAEYIPACVCSLQGQSYRKVVPFETIHVRPSCGFRFEVVIAVDLTVLLCMPPNMHTVLLSPCHTAICYQSVILVPPVLLLLLFVSHHVLFVSPYPPLSPPSCRPRSRRASGTHC